MKKVFLLLLLACFELCAVSARGFDKNIPEAWLNGICIQSDTTFGSTTFLGVFDFVKPETFVVGKDGVGELCIKCVSDKQLKHPIVKNQSFGKNASKLIAYAVKHHYWLALIGLYKSKLTFVSLIPYDIEVESTLPEIVPGIDEEKWCNEGITFAPIPKKGVVTKMHFPCSLALDNGNAILLNEEEASYINWYKNYMYIENVPASALSLLRFLVKHHPSTYITYDKATRKIYKIRLDPKWNETIIVGGTKSSR